MSFFPMKKSEDKNSHESKIIDVKEKIILRNFSFPFTLFWLHLPGNKNLFHNQ